MPVCVALRLECVDRNKAVQLLLIHKIVALRLECVDRNINRPRHNSRDGSRTPFGVRG